MSSLLDKIRPVYPGPTYPAMLVKIPFEPAVWGAGLGAIGILFALQFLGGWGVATVVLGLGLAYGYARIVTSIDPNALQTAWISWPFKRLTPFKGRHNGLVKLNRG